MILLYPSKPSLFQFTPPRGGRQSHVVVPSCIVPISIHAPAWGATDNGVRIAYGKNLFQFTPPRGGRPFGRLHSLRVRVFQFTPPRGGRHAVNGHRAIKRCISIHAPAWGATAFAVPWVGTVLFQFTPPRGGRRCRRGSWRRCWNISIHAPAWGATNGSRIFCFMRASNFNSRPRVGGDRRTPSPARTSTNFNSRPRVGGDSMTIHLKAKA